MYIKNVCYADEISSISCVIAGFGIRSSELRTFATKQLHEKARDRDANWMQTEAEWKLSCHNSKITSISLAI